MDLEITKSDGTSFLLSDHGVLIDDFRVGAISMESEYGKAEGSHGRIDYGSTYGTRSITVPFHLLAKDLLDYPLARDALFALVQDTKAYFVRELRRPKYLHYDFVDINESAVDEYGNRKYSQDSQNVYIGGKRYLVRLTNDFDIDQTLLLGEGELVFETTKLPFAESIGTSQDIEQNGLLTDGGIWGFGMGLLSDESSWKYTHQGTTFRIFNPGNVQIHPFEMMDLVITISEVQESADYLELKNETNGSTFRTKEAVNSDQVIKIDGPDIKSNELAYFRKTNKEYIELDPGWNEFTVSGATSAKVSFDFRFYYL
ncbi:phage tail domain-containing protein [Sediminibacillus massiliensis]|uniref:phage tail domain-containing protein n=1 Tax=Sediminibacillus massiliensis TaxID=1926277 RepID=UPI0009883446|nr:phage tail domain-containing protein [Sediminibacillus massiliensis]